MKKQTILGSLCLFALLFATSACPGPKGDGSGSPKLGFVANSLSIDPPSTAAAVEVSITIEVSVENTGTAASSGGTVNLYESTDNAIIENSDTKVGTAIAIPVIQAGAKLDDKGHFYAFLPIRPLRPTATEPA